MNNYDVFKMLEQVIMVINVEVEPLATNVAQN